MSVKVWLTVFGIVALLLVGGAAFYCFTGWQKYSQAIGGWESRVATIESLERRVPYPKEENAEALQSKVEDYEAAVGDLFQGLDQFQKPLNTTLPNTEFQQLVKTKVGAFREFARDEGFVLGQDMEFQLGFDIYSDSLPSPELVPMLDYELQAIDHLLRSLASAGADELLLFERDPIPGEPGGAREEDAGVVHKYPVRMRFRSTNNAFQSFINEIANDEEYFYIVRVLKVKNDTQEGPPKGDGEAVVSSAPRLVNPDTQERAGPDRLAEWGWPGVSENELIEAAEAEGFILANEDATVLMGQEKLTVFMVVDIARFLDPEGEGDKDGDDDEENS